jgi:hypothetical protein
VNVGDLQQFLRSLGTLLAANQGKAPAKEFDAFCDGLAPFRDQGVAAFAQFLRDAEEYKRTGAVPASRKAAARKPRAVKPAAPKRQPLKKKDDVQAVEEAAAVLQGLYDRATDPALTHEAIEAEVDRIDREFDGEGLKAVARKFGITSGLTSKGAAKAKVLARIAERKGRHERGEVIAEVARQSAQAAGTLPAEPASDAAEPVPDGPG